MGHVHTKVAAVLNFIDAMTERPVRYRVLELKIVQQNKVIWKDAGCAVILEREGVESVDVLISGNYYQEVCLHMALSPGMGPQVQFIWLSPSKCYPFQWDVTMIHGTCFLDGLYVSWSVDSSMYKLSETTTVGSDRISLWGISGSVEGRIFLLCGGGKNGDGEGGGMRELVTLLGPAEQGTYTYCTKESIQHVFYRGKTKLYKASKVHVDNSGYFFMAFRREAQTDGEVLFWRDGGIVAALQTGKEQEYFVTIP